MENDAKDLYRHYATSGRDVGSRFAYRRAGVAISEKTARLGLLRVQMEELGFSTSEIEEELQRERDKWPS